MKSHTHTLTHKYTNINSFAFGISHSYIPAFNKFSMVQSLNFRLPHGKINWAYFTINVTSLIILNIIIRLLCRGCRSCCCCFFVCFFFQFKFAKKLQLTLIIIILCGSGSSLKLNINSLFLFRRSKRDYSLQWIRMECWIKEMAKALSQREYSMQKKTYPIRLMLR